MEEKNTPEKIDLSIEDLPQENSLESSSSEDNIDILVSQKDRHESGHYKRPQDLDVQISASGTTPLPVWQLPLAGILCALLAWGVTEISYEGFTLYYLIIADFLIKTDLFIISVSSLFGAAFGSVAGIYEKKTAKAIMGILIGLLVGAIGGIAGGFAGNTVSSFGNSGQTINVLAYGIAWSLSGFFLGLGQGLGTLKYIGTSAIGGLIGGLLGGIMFNLFNIIIAAPEAVTRGAAICFLGLCIGLGLAIAQRKR